MRHLLRHVASIMLALAPAFVGAQDEGAKEEHDRPKRIDLSDLREGRVSLPGQGEEIPGINLRSAGKPRLSFIDDSANATRGLDDRSWPWLYRAEDSLVPGANTCWVRYHLHPDDELRDRPLDLGVGSSAFLEVYHNGRSILRASNMPSLKGSPGLPDADSIPFLSVPFRFDGDGQTEIIAIRVDGLAGRPLAAAGMKLILRLPDASFAVQRITMNFGLFVGVNVIILVLSVILWFQDRRDSSWPLLALLALIEAFDSVSDVAGDMGLLGFPEGVSGVLNAVAIILKPWPLYLLIQVLRRLRGDTDRRKTRRYAWAVSFLTILFAMGAFAGTMDDGTLGDRLNTTNDVPLWVLGVIVLAVVLLMLMGVVLVWFAVEVIRLAIRLLRTRGYERWIGGGALVSSVATSVFGFFGGFGGATAGWSQMLAQYCDHVAVPVSVAIYLAIRSAHHNKAVARQRDDLDREVQERTAELSLAKKRSDDLLLNILPHEVAEELKHTGSAAAKHFDQATVMFTDFKGFTAMSERVAPGDLLEELNACFRAFDDIIARHGIEKIKTIGDAYMCASGLPDPNASSPTAVVIAALEMQAFMRERQLERGSTGRLTFVMRVGIHTGPVIAGIVGVKKFQYDIWGDTVNTASRMESSGEVGQVNISEATYDLVKNETGLIFKPRGKVGVKGKSDMEMFFVERAPTSGPGGP